MKFMKLILAALVACLMTITLAACGNNETRTEYAGLSFVLPEGWTATESNGDLEISAPEDNGVTAIITGTHYTVNLYDAEEQIGYFTDGAMNSFKSYNMKNIKISSREIDGAYAETITCTITSYGRSVDLYMLIAEAGDGVTCMFLGSTDGGYNAEIEGILDSLKIAK